MWLCVSQPWGVVAALVVSIYQRFDRVFSFLCSLSSLFINFFISFLIHPPPALPLPVLSFRTGSTCRCRPGCPRPPWAACCWQSCRAKMETGTEEVVGKAAGEEQLWSAPAGRKEATACCLTCRPTAALPGTCGTSSIWPGSLGTVTDEGRPARRGGRIRGKRRLWRSSLLVSCAPPLPSPLFSSWDPTPSACPLSCGQLSASLHRYQHCSG